MSLRLLCEDLVSAKSIISANAASKADVGDGVGWGVGLGVGCGVVGADVVGRCVGFLVGETVGLGVEQHSPRTLHELDGMTSDSSPVP